MSTATPNWNVRGASHTWNWPWTGVPSAFARRTALVEESVHLGVDVDRVSAEAGEALAHLRVGSGSTRTCSS
jgi:hypothetical protein